MLINRVNYCHPDRVTRLIKNRMGMNTSGVNIFGSRRRAMVASHEVLDSAFSVQAMPLQFGGNFIELAVLFLILAVVAAVLGARGSLESV